MSSLTTIQVSDAELKILRTALESYNDMQNDTMWEDTELFPTVDNPITITKGSAEIIREALDERITELQHLAVLLNKVGGHLTTKGYSA